MIWPITKRTNGSWQGTGGAKSKVPPSAKRGMDLRYFNACRTESSMLNGGIKKKLIYIHIQDWFNLLAFTTVYMQPCSIYSPVYSVHQCTVAYGSVRNLTVYTAQCTPMYSGVWQFTQPYSIHCTVASDNVRNLTVYTVLWRLIMYETLQYTLYGGVWQCTKPYSMHCTVASNNVRNHTVYTVQFTATYSGVRQVTPLYLCI